ncbi:hypothetical protein CLOSTASPAR_02247 [[Clostridium] asparagiforme DSM 15981]|uniref:Uncharacterized protein n=1 Tax=[Clostridium] asparagiforme DSM 15981 TaxID=518636 RepID=C0CZ20_9FIRM|nr:hypothetical protein CLOSTASPAR_02247 [[Clostridium] asparagiforme DSM 15981]
MVYNSFSVKMRRSARGFNQKHLAERTSAEVLLSYHEAPGDASGEREKWMEVWKTARIPHDG